MTVDERWTLIPVPYVYSNNDKRAAGLMIGLAGVAVMVSIPFWKAFVKNSGWIPAIAVSLALSGLGFMLLGLVDNPFDWFAMLPVAVTAAGPTGCFVTPMILAADLTPPDILGSLLGTFNVVAGLGQIFFIQIGGILFDAIGPASPFVFIGLANLIVMAYAISVTYFPGDRSV